jgi:hypothetical protein
MTDNMIRDVDTEGGAAVDGSVNAGGDFVGRDQHTHVRAEDHSVAVGRDVHGDIHVYHGTAPSPGMEPHQPPPRGRCDYYRHISLPPHYIPRPDLLRQTREALLESDESVALTSAIQQTPAALHGMGGIGKSVLARALCEDSQVQETFSDGILWTTLGQEVTEATLRSKLRAWIEALGGIVSETAPMLEHLKALLAQILKERACLLIVDDVWRRQDAEAFQVGGPRCRLLITTRDAEIAAGLGARLQLVDVLAQEQALELLEEWARGHLDVTDDRVKHQIVKRLGYLPLAVRLAGEQLRRHPPEEWLKNFKARRLRSSRPESVHDNLFLTFSLSLEDLSEQARHCYLALAIFPEDEPLPLAALFRLWGMLAGLDDLASRDLLHDLAARALAQLEETDRGPALILHDLLRDFIAAELGQEGIRNAHRALLEAYRASQAGDGWPTAPNDGYLYDHLAYHLDALAEHDETALDEIQGLFANDAWLHIRVPADDYRYDGYLADLTRVWRRVHAQALAESATGKPGRTIAASVHCALIHTTVNALATNYPPELVARAVETGLWSPARGSSVLQRVADAYRQSRMAASLLTIGRLSEKQGMTVRHLSLAAARAIDGGGGRAEALAALAPHLEGSFLTEALAVAHAIDEKRYRAEALAVLASRWEGETQQQVLTEALATARAIKGERWQAQVLADLSPHLKDSLLTETLAVAHVTEDEAWRAEALAALVYHLEGKAQQQVLIEALAAARAIASEWKQADALAALAPHLEGSLLAEALAVAHIIEDEGYRAAALAALTSYLEGEAQQQVLTEALDAARATESEWKRAEALAALAPHLEGPLLGEALAITHTLAVEVWRANTLAALAPHLEGSLLMEALAAARAIEDEAMQARALVALAPHLGGKVQQQVLTEALIVIRAIDAIADEWWRTQALTALAPHLEGSRLMEALAAARALGDEVERTQALAVLATHLEGEARQRVFTEALAVARALKNESDRAWDLAALAPYLEGSFVTEALAAVRAIEHEPDRAWALAALAPHLKGDLLTQALAAARALEDEGWQTHVLTALASHLEGEIQPQVLAEALATACAIKSEGWRAVALAALAPHLERPLPTEALAAARAIEDEQYRAKALASLAPHLEGEVQQQVLAEALAAAHATQDEGERAKALASLASHLKRDRLSEALAAARALQYEWDQVEVVVALAPHLEGSLLAEALATTRTLESEWHRVDALVGLVPHLEGFLLMEALAVARALEDEGARASALSALVPHLDGELLDDVRIAWRQCLWGYQHRARRDLFNLLAEDDAAFLRAFNPLEEVYTCIVQSIIEICTQWEWL